jgi:hypothetical protein
VTKHGFVYLLGHFAMPGRYKIGHTFNSPFDRSEVLSRATGVPGDFTVLGFIAIRHPQRHEIELHRRFAAVRCEGKEFFQAPADVLWEAMRCNEEANAVCNVEVAPWAYDDEQEQAQKLKSKGTSL